MTESRKAPMSAVIGVSSIIIGNVSGDSDFEVRGKVQGNIEVSGRVLVAEGGVVLGGIQALAITVAGEVRGDLSAQDGVTIETSGQVEGNIEAPRVGIDGGARVRGMLRTGAELLPSEAQPEKKKPKKKPREEKKPEKTDNNSQAPSPAPSPPAAVEDTNVGQPEEAMSDKEEQTSSDALPPEPSALAKPNRPKRKRRAKKDNRAPKEASLEPTSSPKEKPVEAKTEEAPQKPVVTRSKVKPSRQKGPPTPPTFVKGAKGHQRS